MAGEYGASIIDFVSTVVVDHPRLGRVKMDTADYDPKRDGPILDGPTIRTNAPGLPPKPNKDPRLDADGNVIAAQASPMLRA